MNNFRRCLPENTNRHALHSHTNSLSRFTLPRCALYYPGLWDIQLSSRVFCEIIAKVMSLIKRLFSWFPSFTRTTLRMLRQQTSGQHALVTSDDSGRLPITIHALVTKRFRQASRATNAARFVAVTSDH